MYALVDRPVESLTNSGRFLLWAMRGWTHAATRGACPPQALRRDYLNWIAQECLHPGDYYAYEGMEIAVNSVLEKLRAMDAVRAMAHATEPSNVLPLLAQSQ